MEDSEWTGWISSFKKFVARSNHHVTERIDQTQKETMDKIESKLKDTKDLVTKNEAQI